MFVVNCQCFGSVRGRDEQRCNERCKSFPEFESKSTQPTGRSGRQGASQLFQVSFGEINCKDRWLRRPPTRTTCRCESPRVTNSNQRTIFVRFELREPWPLPQCMPGPHNPRAEHFADEMRVRRTCHCRSVISMVFFHYDFGDDWRFKHARIDRRV